MNSSTPIENSLSRPFTRIDQFHFSYPLVSLVMSQKSNQKWKIKQPFDDSVFYNVNSIVDHQTPNYSIPRPNSTQFTYLQVFGRQCKYKIIHNYINMPQIQQLQQKRLKKLIYPHPKLLKYRFAWENLRFIIVNYYLLQAVLSSTFYSFFILSQRQLLPLNIVLILLLMIDYLIKFCLTSVPKLDIKVRMYKTIFRYLCKTYLGIQLLILIIFMSSFITPFGVARWLRLIFMLRFLDIIQYNDQVYRRLELYPTTKKIYTIFKIMYLMFIFSHYFGCWFQLMDQVLLDTQYYGPAASQNLLYYQMNMLCFTPIEAFGDWGRYLYGLYFLVSLITTIAYGDIIGKNPYQQIYVTVLMVLSTITIGLILQQFMNLVRQGSQERYQFIKMYNCLKTKMNENHISMKTQNRVRSYLIFIEYQKKFHTHQPTVEKLTYRLQTQLTAQIYSQYIQDAFIHNLNLISRSDLISLVNCTKVVTFQAQTDIYSEIAHYCQYPRSQLLFKLSGLVQEEIICPFSKYVKESLSSSKRSARKSIKLPTNDKKIFNMANMLLNYQTPGNAFDFQESSITLLKYDQINQLQPEKDEQLEIFSPSIQSMRSPLYLQPQNRILESIKISSFLMMSPQDFSDFINNHQDSSRLAKQISGFKQKILCKQYPLSTLGEFCTVCIKDKQHQNEFELYRHHGIVNSVDKMRGCQHLNEECPRTHYIISENETQYQFQSSNLYGNNSLRKFSDLIRSGYRQRKKQKFVRNSLWSSNRQNSQASSQRFSNTSVNFRLSKNMIEMKEMGKIRKKVQSKKVIGSIKFRIMYPELQESEQVMQESHSNVLKLFKDIIEKLDNKQSVTADSVYDPEGIDRFFSIRDDGTI